MSEYSFDFTLTDSFVIDRFSGGSRIFLGGGGAPTPQSGFANLFFCKSFAKNCMNMKEFGHGGGGGVPAPTLDPPMKYVL